MKRSEFLRRINGLGCELLRLGNRHDIYINTNNGKRAPIPRHKEIADTLTKIILKQLGINKADVI